MLNKAKKTNFPWRYSCICALIDDFDNRLVGERNARVGSSQPETEKFLMNINWRQKNITLLPYEVVFVKLMLEYEFLYCVLVKSFSFPGS